MKYLLIFLFALNAQATFLPQGINFCIGLDTNCLGNPNSVITLVVNSLNGSHYNTFRQVFGSAGYLVPAGGIRILGSEMSTTVNACYGSLGYGDTDVGYESDSAPTTPIGIGGGAYVSNDDLADVSHVTAGIDVRKPHNILFPAGKYIFIKLGNNANVKLYGVLE
jgi:hypothetical protein